MATIGGPITDMSNKKGDKDQICFIPALLKVVYTAPKTTVSKGFTRGNAGETIDAKLSYSTTVVTVEELFKTGKINLTDKKEVIGAIGKEVIQPSNLRNLSTKDKTFIQALNAADADNVFHGGGSKKGVRGTRRKRKKDAK